MGPLRRRGRSGGPSSPSGLGLGGGRTRGLRGCNLRRLGCNLGCNLGGNRCLGAADLGLGAADLGLGAANLGLGGELLEEGGERGEAAEIEPRCAEIGRRLRARLRELERVEPGARELGVRGRR